MSLKQVNKENFQKKTKDFFQSTGWNNLLVFLVFVALAFGFWLLTYYQQKFEIELDVRLDYQNLPPGLALSDSLPQSIQLKVQDKGTVFLSYFVQKRESGVSIDLSEIPLDKKTYTIDRASLSSKIYDNLFSSTQLISFYPELIKIDYSPLSKKKLPVVLNGDLSPASGYIFIDTIQINPSWVWVYGNESALDTLRYVRTELVEKENIKKNLNFPVRLLAESGLGFSEDTVRLVAEVEEYTEKIFDLPVVCYSAPENARMRFFPSRVEIVCQVALSKYAQLLDENLEIAVDYETALHNKSTSLPVTLTKKPDWLIHYRCIPDRIEYLIEQK